MSDYRLTRFQAWHLDVIRGKGDAEGGYVPIDEFTLRCMERAPNSWTVVVDGEPLMCGGTLALWEGRHLGWAYLAKNAGAHMVSATRAAKRKLAEAKGRVEITVRSDFEPGHRFARMLGFEIETPILRAFAPGGVDHTGYVRFNKG